MPLFVRLVLSYSMGTPYGNQTSKTNLDAYFPSFDAIPDVPDKVGISTAICSAISAAQYSLVAYDKVTWHELPLNLPAPGTRLPYDPTKGISIPVAVTGSRATAPTGDFADPRYCVWIGRGGFGGLPGRLAIRGCLTEPQVQPSGDVEVLQSGAISEFTAITAGIEAGFTLIEEEVPFQLGIATYPQTGTIYPAVPAGTEQVPVKVYGPRQFRPAPVLTLNHQVLVLPLNKN